MRYFLEFSDEAKALGAAYQDSVASFFKMINAADEGATITPDTDVMSAPTLANKLFVVRDGYFSYKVDERRVLFYETGDLLGLDALTGGQQGTISSPFPVRVDVYDYETVKTAISNSADALDCWNKLLVNYSSLLRSLVTTATEGQLHFSPNEKLIRSGEVVIQEGTAGKEVYSLVSGKLEVFSGDAKVGEVLEGELFGVIAALTDSNRTATVKASADSIVLSVPADKFVELVRRRPATLGKLLESFARILTSTNQQTLNSAVQGISGLKAG